MTDQPYREVPADTPVASNDETTDLDPRDTPAGHNPVHKLTFSWMSSTKVRYKLPTLPKLRMSKATETKTGIIEKCVPATRAGHRFVLISSKGCKSQACLYCGLIRILELIES